MPGEDISNVPVERVWRAERHIAELMHNVRRWQEGIQPSYQATYSADRRTVTLAIVAPPPPPDLVSTVFADCVHNLRSSLDSLAYELAKLGGAKAHELEDIQFPVAMTEHQWSSAKGKLATMPKEALERIEKVQPSHQLEPNRSSLYVLHRVDILNKHRSGLHARLLGREIKLDGLEVEFEEDPGSALLDDVVTWSPLSDVGGSFAVALVGRSQVPIRSLKTQVQARAELYFAAEAGEILLGESLRRFLGVTWDVLETVTGVSLRAQRQAPEWPPSLGTVLTPTLTTGGEAYS